MGQKPETSKDAEEKPKEKRLDLSVPQVAGSAVAAVVAAKLASSFGVYGTILGAGVVSALATCGGTVFQHFFRRTGEQIRDVAVQTKPKGRQVPVTESGRPVPRTFRSDASMDTTKAMATGAAPPAARPRVSALPTTTTWGVPRTRAQVEQPQQPQQPSAGTADDERTQLLDTGAVADLLADTCEKTRLLGTVGPVDLEKPKGDQNDLNAVNDQADQADQNEHEDQATRVLRSEEFGGATVHRARVRGLSGWKRPLIAAAVVFGVTMGGITTYELVSGSSLSGDDKGTTVWDAFKGGSSSGSRSDPAPSTSSQPSGGASTGSGDGTRQGDGDGSSGGRGGATPTPTPSDGSSPDTGADTGSGADGGSGSGSDGSSTSPTPTPSPSQSSDPAATSGAGTPQAPPAE
ncbi:hypothetical protein [Streptomyces beihaiensis]|uniref:Uncharacterized protein n=1 Tax=Streptomyces beihaiensis TaxID=2984495 RepID=A0ABT3TU83_9ACTN|nr:hypothetical protein [Streptomyces beihaiensis]MCX3060588.1 hypothetical protein [Streptomyces beihaiensis]